MKIILIRHAGDIKDVKPMRISEDEYKLYSSPEEAAKETAAIMWPDNEYELTPLLSELSDIEAGDKSLAAARVDEFLDMAEKNGADIIAISHERLLKVLYKRLKKRGYLVKRTNMFKVDFLEKAVATKRRDRCGHCTQDCLLTNPGCEIGRDLAAREKQKNNR